jgi:hypothetical protein
VLDLNSDSLQNLRLFYLIHNKHNVYKTEYLKYQLKIKSNYSFNNKKVIIKASL